MASLNMKQLLAGVAEKVGLSGPGDLKPVKAELKALAVEFCGAAAGGEVGAAAAPEAAAEPAAE